MCVILVPEADVLAIYGKTSADGTKGQCFMTLRTLLKKL